MWWREGRAGGGICEDLYVLGQGERDVFRETFGKAETKVRFRDYV